MQHAVHEWQGTQDTENAQNATANLACEGWIKSKIIDDTKIFFDKNQQISVK